MYSANVPSSWKLQVAIESLLERNVVKNVALLMSWHGWSAQHVTWKCPDISAEPLSLGGINNNKSEEAPLTTVIKDIKTLDQTCLNNLYTFEKKKKPEIPNFICNKSSQRRSYDISHRNDPIYQSNLRISVKSLIEMLITSSTERPSERIWITR